MLRILPRWSDGTPPMVGLTSLEGRICLPRWSEVPPRKVGRHSPNGRIRMATCRKCPDPGRRRFLPRWSDLDEARRLKILPGWSDSVHGVGMENAPRMVGHDLTTAPEV